MIPARNAVRYAYVPFMLLGLNGAAYYLVSHGHSYLWLSLLLATAFATAYAAERIAPCFDEWNHSHGEEAATVWHTIVYEFQNISGILMIPVIAWVLQIQPGTLLGFWPLEWPLLAQVLLAIVLTDFGLTLMHYLSHRLPTLWRLHAVHHGVERLHGFNGLVRHPLHQIIDLLVVTGPLALAGMPVPVALLLGFAVSVQLIVQHSNVDYALGPFRNQLAIGRIHHLHHVNWGVEGDCNFGLFFTLWDRMLGTFKPEPPRAIQAHDMGIDDVPNFPKSYLEQLTFPFKYTPGTQYGEPEPAAAAPAPMAPADAAVEAPATGRTTALAPAKTEARKPEKREYLSAAE